jgi:hypothetical protein
MSNLSTFYKPAVTRDDLGLGTANNVTFASIQNTPIGNTTPAAITGTAGTFTTLTANNGTLTASAPVLDLAQTWNDSGITFTGILANFTNTQSANTSAYVSIALDGTEAFAIRRGEANANATIIRGGGAGGLAWTARTRTGGGVGLNFQHTLGIGAQLEFLATASGTGAGDVALLRDGASDTLAQRRTTNAQTFNIYNTFTSATNHERGFLKWSSNNVFQIGTEAGSGGGTARALVFQTDGVTRMTIAADGNISFPSAIQLDTSGLVLQAATSFINFANDCIVRRDEADVFAQRRTTSPQAYRIYNTFASTTSFERLNIRWASNECIIDAQAGSGGGTLRGIKLGSASTSLLGFFGATPVVQQAAVADATDAASTQDRLNDLLARLRTLGLIAT